MLLDNISAPVGAAARGIRKFLGLGAYSGGRQVPKALLEASKVPYVNSITDKGIIIGHHEFIGDVSSSVEFKTTRYPINPGLDITFPWLAGVAPSFQEWDLIGCMLCYNPTSGNAVASTTTTLGAVIGSVAYPLDIAAPSSKIQALGMAGAVSTVPSQTLLIPVETAKSMRMSPNLLVRNAGLPETATKQLYDIANFDLSTVGSQAACVVGELWISYTVLLKLPTLRRSTAGVPYMNAQCDEPIDAHPLADPGYFTNTLNGVIASAGVAGDTITLPAGLSGTYRVELGWGGTSATVVPPTCYGSNTSPATMSPAVYPPSGTTSTNIMVVFNFLILDPSQPVVLTVGPDGTLPTGTAVCYIKIMKTANSLGLSPREQLLEDKKEEAARSEPIRVQQRDDIASDFVLPERNIKSPRAIGVSQAKVK